MSLVDKDGEWRNKRVTIMGVVQGFVSQLKIGQDLTRVSLPALFLYPFSMLEVLGQREVSAYDVLCTINTKKTPLERMIAVVTWLLETLPQELWRKKPYNPLLGETHECWTESKEHGKTVFISEQVSHHPPVSAFTVTNAQAQVSLTCNVSFGVKYGGNSLSIVTSGGGKITCEQFKEHYELSKRAPDMVVRHLIWGSKKMFWEGDIRIVCPESNYFTQLSFSKSGHDNIVKGTVFHETEKSSDIVYTIEGKCGSKIYYFDDKNDKKLLVDVETVTRSTINYQKPDELDSRSSLKVWAAVNKFIVSDEIDKADEAKKQIEEEQRKNILKNSATPHTAHFFTRNDNEWVLKSDVDLNPKSEKDTQME